MVLAPFNLSVTVFPAVILIRSCLVSDAVHVTLSRTMVQLYFTLTYPLAVPVIVNVPFSVFRPTPEEYDVPLP